MLAIVVTAYNRSIPLKNLLCSLLKIRIENERIPLIISIDNGGTPEVNKVAEEFEWPFGRKEVIIHNKKKGLVNHFIWAGDQTEKYDYVVFLEDDLLVSPELIDYCKRLIEFYENDNNIAAASLYNPILNEATGTKFYQLEDGYDVYFLQQPYWGNIWFKNKWKDFKKYLETYKVNEKILPSNIAEWDCSFKKIYIQYLIESNKTVVTPRVSLVTNNGNAGIHSGDLYEFQSNLQLTKKDYRFIALDESISIYDSFVEISSSILKKYCEELRDYNFEVDINGNRRFYHMEYVLTSKPVKRAILSYTSLMKPTELGIIMGMSGNKNISLCKATDVIDSHKYVRMRRYHDILKNYHIGVWASFYISKYLIAYLCKIIFHKTKIKIINF